MKKLLFPLLLFFVSILSASAQTIENATVVGATTKIAVVCPGGTFDLSFNLKNFRCAGTTFTVELARPGGNGPVVISTQTVANPQASNVVSVTMPNDAPNESLYQVRVYSTRPSGCSNDPLRATSNTVNLRVRTGNSVMATYQLPPYNANPRTGPLNICPGQEFRLVALPSESGLNYTWTGLETGFAPLVNVTPNGERVQTTAQTAGMYTATVTPSFPAARGCSVSGSNIAINVSGGASKPQIQAANATICEGGKTTLSLTNSCEGTVTWNNGTSDIGSGSSIMVMPSGTTNYTAKCTTTGQCASSQTSDPLTVTVSAITIDMFAVGVTPQSPTAGPRAGDIKLNLSNGDILTYPAPRMWTALINACPGASNVESVQMQLTGPGINFATVENFAPFALFFNQGADVFYTINDPDRGIGPAFNNGWPTGNYTLTITPRDQDGTSSGALPKDRAPAGNAVGGKTVNFTIQDPVSARVGVSENTSAKVRLYPNPTTDYISVEVNAGLRQPVTVQLSDLQGRSVYSNSVTTTDVMHREQINIQKQPQGLYLLKVITKGGVETVKVLKAQN
ncbi:T9SS C-terminal target domain-containing protein [Fibrisoma montanum]|uniref:T9SS C-terminal target domain-containing protein n=1 Tax=Fibrisoma montanum TaxID=2305895 RepID=A0A418MF63_9BACT|nr:T9SS type A sorting domain-containing protein [Fibrisoma montanum]RIV25373.1 T9SS C-terminal target domain-containing protein [Fibrisoma montanum]